MNGSKEQLPVKAQVDVLVVGGGNAALCAAITAREQGANVLLLESSPEEFRGGNSRHTRNLRSIHRQANSFLTGPYLEDECFKDLLFVTKGNTDEEMARFVIQKSEDCPLCVVLFILAGQMPFSWEAAKHLSMPTMRHVPKLASL